MNEVTPERMAEAVARLPLPTGDAVARRARGVLDLMMSMEISDPDMLATARDELGGIKSLWERIEEERKVITVPLNTVLDNANGYYQPALKTLKLAEKTLKDKIGAFLDAEEEKARALKREQDRLLQLERDRLEAERQRIQREADAAAEKLRREADAAAQKLAQDELTLREQMRSAQQAGDTAQAVELRRQTADVIETTARVIEDGEASARHLEQRAAIETANIEATAAVMVALPEAPVATARSVGLSSTKTMDCEVVDLVALVKHISASPELIGLLEVNTKALRAYTKALGMNAQLPGVRFFEKRTIRA